MSTARTKWQVAILVSAAVGFTVVSQIRPSRGEEQGEPLPAELFKDKVVMLEVDRSSAVESKSSTLVLLDAAIVKIGERLFIYGTGHAPSNHQDSWYHGVKVGIAWDKVNRFYALTPDKFDSYAAKYEDQTAIEE